MPDQLWLPIFKADGRWTVMFWKERCIQPYTFGSTVVPGRDESDKLRLRMKAAEIIYQHFFQIVVVVVVVVVIVVVAVVTVAVAVIVVIVAVAFVVFVALVVAAVVLFLLFSLFLRTAPWSPADCRKANCQEGKVGERFSYWWVFSSFFFLFLFFFQGEVLAWYNMNHAGNSPNACVGMTMKLG